MAGGFCLRAPAQGACSYTNICEHCPSYRAEPSSLPILAAQRVDADLRPGEAAVGSRARLVITAITTQGVSQAEAARTYDLSQAWVSRLMAGYRVGRRARLPSNPAHDDPRPPHPGRRPLRCAT